MFTGLEEDWNMIRREMNDTKEAQIKLLEVKNTLFEMKNTAAKINSSSA